MEYKKKHKYRSWTPCQKLFKNYHYFGLAGYLRNPVEYPFGSQVGK